MVKFKLIEIVDGFYHYEIYPEGKEEGKGVFIFNPKTREVKKIFFRMAFILISYIF